MPSLKLVFFVFFLVTISSLTAEASTSSLKFNPLIESCPGSKCPDACCICRATATGHVCSECCEEAHA
ncbi:hypothetical protein AQUCO_00200615v1 [Aquilegia coerulea]|uniref:Bowman-Birk serine protease inhibitors family domain-containing protein n=1 Tax=Aquilegia coerulea TaxID=218851 RepID=A0A2G5F441_AQUCA|nr:hypothetical protein AQUCO_00200615v1 [Aquilegia coerulea]